MASERQTFPTTRKKLYYPFMRAGLVEGLRLLRRLKKERNGSLAEPPERFVDCWKWANSREEDG
jgi:hypothetical protein